MTLGGEVSERRAVKSHLFRGGILAIVGYLIVTLSLLVIEGPHAAVIGPFALVSAITLVFGKVVGDLVAVCTIAFFFVLTALFNSIFARFLLVGALDRRIPIGLGRLDENRVPIDAIIAQTIIVVLFASAVFLLPYLIPLGDPFNLTTELFTLSLYSHSMIWAIASIFLFVDLLVLYLRNPRAFHARRIFPMPVLWTCILVAPLACVLAVIVTLSYSPIPQLIPTNLWGGIVGGLTLLWLFFAALGSVLASGEAAWEDFSAM